MKISIHRPTVMALSVLLGIAACGAYNCGPYSLIKDHRFGKPMFSTMTSPRYPATGGTFSVNNQTPDFLESKVYSNNGDVLTRGALSEPTGQFTNLGDYNEISTPEGIFFVTTKLQYESVVINEYYTEQVLKGFEFTFYNPDFQEVGKIKDKIYIDTEKGETTPAHCVIGQSITRNFFNDDDNYEVMVYLGIRTNAALNYEMHFYEKVYSIGGEKDDSGNDKCIYSFNGRLVDQITTGSESETLLTFVDDEYFPEIQDKVERANATTTHIKVYGKGATEPKIVYSKDIFMANYPGDTTESPYVISKEFNGRIYYIFSHYEKPYFMDPTGGAVDERATHDNFFMIELMAKEGDTLVPVKTTKIPVLISEDGSQLLYNFYSVGDLTWKNDIDMMINGTPESPAYIVRYAVCSAAELDDLTSSYFIYDADGNLIKPLVKDSESFSLLSSQDNDQPHIMFVRTNEQGDYQFDFVDLYSGELKLSIPQVYEEEALTATCDRVKGTNGEYKYAFVMMYDDIDKDYNVYKRIAWFDHEGKLTNIDNMNIGKDVQASTVYLVGPVLDPYLYDTDANMEYAVLVKRTYGQTVRNEFVVVDDSGEWYAHFSADDGRGDPATFKVEKGENGGRLYMIYVGNRGFNIDVYTLPFETLAVNSILDEDGTDANFADGVFHAPGGTIEIFTYGGLRVASATNLLDIDNLSRGVYVAVIKGANGKISTIKFIK